ncbi:hypothetical protein OCV46_01255 [Anthropogastromicrobium aceti]|uniref:hypothetical protein n=1 Tax=Anthropogastromicrobium aceti TaxID=2981768 RepID=UPI00082321B5|nr:hypothetical protein [Anthropogastromicrobium aceti]MCU6782581.1 hypothetical protein [Anthropogastromicrobium aceti]SCI89789.1 Uncharacterised protein [uncultured Lachnospira sp.]
MRSTKKPNARQLTSTLMAIVMTATTTFQTPNIALASEADSSVAVESQIEEVTTKEASSVEVQSETATQAAEAETQISTALETSSADAGTDATQVSDEVQATVAETTAEVTYEEEKTTLSAEVDPSGEDTEESEANETRGPDEELTTEIETEAQTDAASEEETEASTKEALIDLSTATKDEILAYIEAIGGAESDAYYEFLSGLGEDDYKLVWIAQFGSEKEMMAEMDEKDFADVVDLEENEALKKEAEGGRQMRINISLTDGVFSAECVDDAGKKVSCEMALLDADGIAIMRWKQPEEKTPFVKLEKDIEYAAVVWKMEDSDAKAAPDVSFLYHDGKLAHKKTDERLDEDGAPVWAKPLFIGMAALFLFLLAILLFPKRRF